MTNKELAESFTRLCAEGKFAEAGRTYWAEDAVSREPVPGAPVARGRAALIEKGQRWEARNQVHAVKVEGPYVSGDQFVVRFQMDLTPEGEARQTFDEVGLYTVKNGKISEELFFYG